MVRSVQNKLFSPIARISARRLSSPSVELNDLSSGVANIGWG